MTTKGMIQLKKVVSKKKTTTIGIYMNDFNCEHTWWSNKPVKAEFLIPLDTTCLFLRVGGFWPVFRHSKNPTSAKIYTTHSLYYRIKFRQTYTPLAPSASLVLTFHMDWTSDQKQAFWNCNDEEQSLISNLLEDTVHL